MKQSYHNIEEGKELNKMLSEQQLIIDFLKTLKASKAIPDKLYNSLYPHGSHPGIIMAWLRFTNPWLMVFPN